MMMYYPHQRLTISRQAIRTCYLNALHKNITKLAFFHGSNSCEMCGSHSCDI
jgi:hypothetical protein